MPLIDSDTLKPACEAYQATREVWDAAMTELAKANTARVSPVAIQRLQDEMQQAHEAVFASAAELAEAVATAISRAEAAASE